jgi:hypothetical protein
MRRVAVWLILISYSLMACGNMLEAGCCHNEAAHAAGEHAEHEHAHSKVLVAVHGLSHESVPGETKLLVSRHCCCVKQGEQEPGLPPHSLTQQCRTPKASDFPYWTIRPEKLAISAIGSTAGASHIFDSLATALVLQSIHSTILLV